MNRRDLVRTLSLGAPAISASAQAQNATRGLPALKITDVRTIHTQPGGDQLFIVKVMTSEPGLFGVGCATHRERPLAVATAINEYLRPFVIGKSPD